MLICSTRRQFLAASAALPTALRSLAQSPSPRWLFLGTDTGKGIYRAPWNPRTGQLGSLNLAVEAARPDFLALHPTLPVLYTVNSVSAPAAAVSSYRIDRTSGDLTLINRRGTQGSGPCSLSIDATGSAAFTANYSAGSMTAFQLGPDGSLTQTIGVFRYNQATHGPVTDRQDAAHLHCTTISPANDFVVTCDLGDDVILLFPIKPAPTDASPSTFVGQPLRIPARPGSGPRHVAFHPNGRWLYCIHELDCTIDLYDWRAHGDGNASNSAAIMTLRDNSVVSTLPPGTPSTGNTACEIILSDDGRFLYSCTRGITPDLDQIVTYRIDPSSGLLTEAQRLSCGGRTPRYIAFDPSRRWLLSCNQASPGSVTVFARDPTTGHLNPKPKAFPANTPMFALWV